MEPARQDTLAALVLMLLQLINQAYFMGFFFLISGYLTPRPFDRKGAAYFLKDRLLRQDIPTLLSMFVLSPITYIGIYQISAKLTRITTYLT
jgi:fucose 4-O-acetylase-like acetyltransferase